MRFGVLGPLAVWTATGDPVTVPESKVRALLAALLVDPGHVVSSDRLAEFLWAGHPPANLSGAIQTRVSRLRRALGADLVEHRAPGYRLAVDPETVDASRFTALTAAARTTPDPASRRARLAEALDLWRGEPFADFADSALVRPAITRLTQQRLVALEELAEARLELGEAPTVAADLRDLVDTHPRRERLRAIHMRALYRAGRQAEALDGYHELREQLGADLGLDPSPELTELYGRMLRHEAVAVAGNRPTAASPAASAAVAASAGGAVSELPPVAASTDSGSAGSAVADTSAGSAARPATQAAADGPAGSAVANASAGPAARPATQAAADGSATGRAPAGASAASTAQLATLPATRADDLAAAQLATPTATQAAADGPAASSAPAGASAASTAHLVAPSTAQTDGRAAVNSTASAAVAASAGAAASALPPVAASTDNRAVGFGDAGRGNLPRPLSALIGRDSDLAELRPLLREHRLVTLTGMGGVGKTSLAVAAARAAVAEAVDGTWLVELAAQPESATVEQLAEVVAATLGLRDDQVSRGSADPVGRLSEALRGRDSRLLLDNCEHLVDVAAELAEILLRAAPRLSILATSQEPLGIAGEQLVPVPALRPDAAVELFTARARGAVPGFTVTDADSLAAICARLDGIPLALELAANRVRVLGLAELERRLRDRFGVLTGGRRDAPARQRTLRAMLDWSWELLTAAERIVLRRLAIHAEGCTLAAAEATCATDGVRSDEVLDLLARLVDRSLVLVSHTAAEPRYRLLESVAAYCLDRLREAGDAEAARHRHAAHYIELAERGDTRLRGPGQAEALAVLDAEAANFRLAFDTAIAAFAAGSPASAAEPTAFAPEGGSPAPAAGSPATDPEPAGSALPAPASASAPATATAEPGGPPSATAPIGPGSALRLVTALSWYWFLRGRLTEPKRMLSQALSASDPADPRRARVTVAHYTIRLLAGDTDLAADGFPAEADRAFERIDDPGPRALLQWFLAHALTFFGDWKLAQRLLDQALTVFTDLDVCWGYAAVVYSRAEVHYDRGRLATARKQGLRALELFAEAGDDWGRSQAATLLGRLAEVAGDYPEATAMHRAALDAAEPLGLWSAVSIGNSELGRIALLTGDLERADRHHERARRIAVEHADRPAQEYAELGLAMGARRRSRWDTAEEHLLRWLDWNRELETDFGVALILAELGFVAEQRGDAATALAHQREGLAAARRTGNPRAVALALEGLAGAHSLAGRAEPAARLLGSAAALRQSLSAPLPQAERGDVDRVTTRIRAALGESRLRELLAEGAAADPRTLTGETD